MARLHVEACTAERTAGDVAQRLLVGVSVSVVESGVPVTGLANENFRLTPVSVGGDLVIASRDLAVLAAREGYWEPDGVELAGCYQLEIGYTRPSAGIPPRKPLRTRHSVPNIHQRRATSGRGLRPDGHRVDQLRCLGGSAPRVPARPAAARLRFSAVDGSAHPRPWALATNALCVKFSPKRRSSLSRDHQLEARPVHDHDLTCGHRQANHTRNLSAAEDVGACAESAAVRVAESTRD